MSTSTSADYRRLRRALGNLVGVVMASAVFRRGGFGLDVSVALNAAKKALTETPEQETPADELPPSDVA